MPISIKHDAILRDQYIKNETSRLCVSVGYKPMLFMLELLAEPSVEKAC